MEEKEKKRKAQLWTVHRYTEGHCMGDICYGHTCLVVFMYTYRNIFINTERKGKNNNNKNNNYIHVTLEEGEGDKEGERGGWGGEMWVLVDVLLC